MLRITTERSVQRLTFRLEGRFGGPWVSVLAECWEVVSRETAPSQTCVDLDGVTFVDAAGKAQLMAMHDTGVELLSNAIEMQDIVADIRAAPAALNDQARDAARSDAGRRSGPA